MSSTIEPNNKNIDDIADAEVSNDTLTVEGKMISDAAVKQLFSEVQERFVMKTQVTDASDAAAYAREQGDYAREQTETLLGTIDGIEALLDELNA